MYKESIFMYLYAETPLHLGSGSSVGVVDLPIQRESITQFPMGQSSGIKGALREWFEGQSEPKQVKTIFGPSADSDDKFAGCVSFSDARILLFPTRSFKGVFAWVTCPLALHRLTKDLVLSGREAIDWSDTITGQECIVTTQCDLKVGEQVVLEESTFQVKTAKDEYMDWIVTHCLPGHPTFGYFRKLMKKKLVIISDEMFSLFVRHNTQIITRTKLGAGKSADTKQGGNLFYEENLPQESVLYCTVQLTDPYQSGELKSSEDVKTVLRKLDNKRVQFGGNETIGRGIMTVKLDMEEHHESNA